MSTDTTQTPHTKQTNADQAPRPRGNGSAPRNAQPAPAKAPRVRLILWCQILDGVVLHLPIPPRPEAPYDVIINHNRVSDRDSLQGLRTIADQTYREICAQFATWDD